jgi:nicotinamidase/pyrazinamidase
MRLDALILIDLQYDFMPGGPLGVQDGNQVTPVANRLIEAFEFVVASQDWHPRNHSSFASNHRGHAVGEVIEIDGISQILWPDHCVQNTPGARLVSDLNTATVRKIFRKGTDPAIDSYSAFFDNGHLKSTGLGDYLKAEGVDRVWLMGLATDYCVRFSALDARALGFETVLIEDGCRGVELAEGDSARAVARMREAGVRISSSREVSDQRR